MLWFKKYGLMMASCWLLLALAPLTQAQWPVPRLENVRCPFSLPARYDMQCRTLLVAEDRTNPDSRLLRLAVAIFRHPDGNPEPDPIIYLEGGPGGSVLETIRGNFTSRYAPLFAANRDIIVLDARGVGASEPTLDCPYYETAYIELLDRRVQDTRFSLEEVQTILVNTLRNCGENLAQQVDLRQYNSAALAADVNDLRMALGYEQVNLWGVSYGTRLGLTILRDYPTAVRSAVLDSVYPPDVNLYTALPTNAQRAFDTLFDHCEQDLACATTYPDLRQHFYALVDRLDAEPELMYLQNWQTGSILTGALYDGGTLLYNTFQVMYSSASIPQLPQWIYEAHNGNFVRHNDVWSAQIASRSRISRGQMMAVQCHEELAFTEVGSIAAAWVDFPLIAAIATSGLNSEQLRQSCRGYDTGAAPPRENQAVYSEVPALLFGGEFDPITPPEWAFHAAQTLPNSYAYEIPAASHGATLALSCPRAMMIAFLIHPARPPDDRCLQEMTLEFSGTDPQTEPVDRVPVVQAPLNVKIFAQDIH